MVQTMYLVSVSQPQTGAKLVNGVVAVIVNASSVASAKSNAALACNAAFGTFANTSDSASEFFQGQDNFKDAYFDTAVAISAGAGVPAAGNGSVNGDAYVIPEPATAPVYVDHSAYTPVV